MAQTYVDKGDLLGRWEASTTVCMWAQEEFRLGPFGEGRAGLTWIRWGALSSWIGTVGSAFPPAGGLTPARQRGRGWSLHRCPAHLEIPSWGSIEEPATRAKGLRRVSRG